MQLTYIFHSSFAVECDTCTLVLDFWRDVETKTYPQGFVQQYLLKKNTPIYVFSSHFHRDHFNPEILKWKENHTQITYIFGKDILKEKLAREEEACFLAKGEVYQDNNISVKAFGSTDSGVSFLISLEDKLIFHAGDLNNWHWQDGSTVEESKEAENNYLKELVDIQNETPYLDLAMFPVDNRMGSDYYRGATQFVKAMKVKNFAPMHFGKQYKAANAFKEIAIKNGAHFLSIKCKGEEFKI